MGVLYKQDLYSILPSKEDLDKEIDNKRNGQGLHPNIDKKLEEIIDKIKQEVITNVMWDKINGVKNFVRVTADENLLSARAKMYGLNRVSDVRCVVIDDPSSDLPIGIFGYDSILYFAK